MSEPYLHNRALTGAVCQVNDVVLKAAATAESQRRELGSAIELRVELGVLSPLAVDADALHDAILAMLLHAVRNARQRFGVVTVTTEGGVQPRVMVSDNGACLGESDIRDRLENVDFSPLAQVQHLVRELGATLKLVNLTGSGTESVLSFGGGDDAGAELEPASSAAAPRGHRILVVDDEALVREIIGIYLAEDNHEVVFAHHGADGLSKFQEEEFDLVLTDRSMPHMSGDELAVAIKQIRPQVPVLLLTGYGDFMGPGQTPAGVDAIVSKPFTLGALREAIGKFA